MKAIVAYVPVLHDGYIKFFEKHSKNADTIYVLGQDLIDEFGAHLAKSLGMSPGSVRREIRQMDPVLTQRALMGISGQDVKVLEKSTITSLKGFSFILPNDELSRWLEKAYLFSSTCEFDDVFLRWDSASVYSETTVNYDRVSESEFDLRIMALAEEIAQESSDWWRQVGAVVVKDTWVYLEDHNRHVPSEHTPYIDGDPRDFVKAGERSEIASALHGEQSIICTAVREGISLKGASIYVTTFPCPLCAKLIAYSGISKVFFRTGHANQLGEAALKAQGVEVILVK